MPNYQCITVDDVDRVTTVTVNRPHQRNAMSPQLDSAVLGDGTSR